VSDLIARAKVITNQDSLAATDARQQFKQEFDARAAACEASKSTTKNSAGGDSGAPDPGVAQDSSVHDLLDHPAKEDSTDKAVKSGKEMQKETVDFVKSAKEAWRSLNGEGSGMGGLKQACEALGDSFEMAAEASSGELPAYTKSIEALKQYVEKQAEVLNELAHKTPQDWLAYSGATDAASFASAQQQLDAVSTQFASIQNIAQHFMPIVKAAEQAAEDQSIVGIRFAATPVTTVGLDPIALDWIWSQLSGSTASLDAIQSNIRAARAAIQDEKARAEAAQLAREQQEEEDQKLNTGISEEHSNWESRRDARKQQQDALMRQMNQIISSEPNEDRRHVLLEDISQQLKKIHQDQELDREPK
jgi:hypothetical protein